MLIHWPLWCYIQAYDHVVYCLPDFSESDTDDASSVGSRGNSRSGSPEPSLRGSIGNVHGAGSNQSSPKIGRAGKYYKTMCVGILVCTVFTAFEVTSICRLWNEIPIYIFMLPKGGSI